MSHSDSKFRAIDDALAQYYRRLNVSNYHDSNGVGLFLKYIIAEELNDPVLPIEEELGDACDPNDCAYSWMNNDTLFPIPRYAQIPHHQKEVFIFYILQYCYKHSQPPSDHYIQQTLIPKCNGTVNPTLAPQNTAPMAFAADLSLPDSKEDVASNYSTDSATEQEGVPTTKALPITRLTESEFKPKYPARAHLNIFTAKELTKELRGVIAEEFEHDLILYYYSDISTALQINDHQMKEFRLLIGEQEQKISVICYDLHAKDSGQELYGVIVPNDNYKIQQDKWLWKLDEFLTAREICDKYKIRREELPLSSRKMSRFVLQLGQTLVIEESLIDETDWFSVQQIKSLKRNVRVPKVMVTLSKEMWITECKKAFQNVHLPLIPVVVNKNNNHWIEWIKIIYVESQNIYVGISCKYEQSAEAKWSVQSICLDRGDIYNKHRLVGLKLDEYNAQLCNFKTSITEIKFSDNDSKDIDKKINVLKQQIRSQQDSIVRLKESLLRSRNANKYSVKECHINGANNAHHRNRSAAASPSESKQSLSQHIREFIDEPEPRHAGNASEDWLDQIVDDVIRRYDVLDFKTSPIGAKRNIYIDKQFTKLWMKHVWPRFHDEAMMYYWLDYTTAMQMCQGYSKQYVDKERHTFMLAIINYELRDQHHNVLYGVILCDDEKLDKKNDKYPYKLRTLMTATQIGQEYGINCADLPLQSRKNRDFVNKLLLKRRIIKQDLNKINWSNLKLFKSQSTNNDPINKSVTITQKVMKEYCNIALERLNTSNANSNNNSNNLIPIVVIDKHHNYYGIEWVLIVHIIHRNCDVGISFRYDEKLNMFAATAIYLDKGEIESKHKLIGLKFDYCKHLRPFSLRKFKFKSDRHSIIDDDDDIALHSGHSGGAVSVCGMQQELSSYKRALEMEQSKVRQLQLQMQQTQSMYAGVKYQNDQYLMQQTMAVAAYNQYNAAAAPLYQMNANINQNQFNGHGYNGYSG